MQLITLTGTDNNILLLNIAAVAYLRPAPAGGTAVHTTGGEEVTVTQMPDVVLAAINDALK
jgi:hypothetical protein